MTPRRIRHKRGADPGVWKQQEPDQSQGFFRLKIGVFKEGAGRSLEDYKAVFDWWVHEQIANLETVISKHAFLIAIS
jgi:hypothetical protein